MDRLERAFITIELVFALAIMALTVGALADIAGVATQGHGRSSVRYEALSHAHMALASLREDAQIDERLVHGSDTHDGIFDTSITIGDAPDDPYTEHTATAHVSWTNDFGTSSQDLTTIITDYQNAQSFDTCGSLDGDWTHAQHLSHALVAGDLLPNTPPSGHLFGTQNPLGGLDVYRGIAIAGLSSKSAKTNDSLFLFDTHSWTYLGSINTNGASVDGTAGVVQNGSYVFVANPHSANFKTCRVGPSCAQVQVVDIRDPHVPTVVANTLLATSSGAMVMGNNGQAVGKSIALAGTTLYLGLTKSATGPEFNMFDVSSATQPVWRGGYTVGAGVSAIDVRGGYAYIATDSSSHELVILDVRDPADPVLIGSYNVTDGIGWGSGNSVYVMGTTTYLGLTYAAGMPDLYVLSSLDRLTPFDLSTATASSTIAGIIARVGHVFVLNTTAQKLQLFDTTGALPVQQGSFTLAGQGKVLDCERNTLYIGSTASNGTIDTLQII